MVQISSYHAKLQLLQKAQEIDEQTKQREVQSRAMRAQKSSILKSRNDHASWVAANEANNRSDEAVRRELVSKLRDCSPEAGFQPVVDVLENYEGKLNI